MPNRKIFFPLLLPLGIFFSLLSFSIHALPDGKLRLYFLNVGQGDSALIKTPNGTKILVDGGPFKNILNEFGGNLSFWDRSIDYVIMTHPDKDHYEGLIHVLKRYRVKNFLMNGAMRKDSAFQALLKELESRNIRIYLINKNSDFSLSDGTMFDFLSPEKSSVEYQEKNTNQGAIVFLLASKNKKILYTADIDDDVEKNLLPALKNIDLLKVAHHGSRYGSTKEFLHKTKPEIAVISVGENRYGHPHPDTLARLTEAGAQVYRTDAQGTVRFSF